METDYKQIFRFRTKNLCISIIKSFALEIIVELKYIIEEIYEPLKTKCAQILKVMTIYKKILSDIQSK